MLSASSGKVMLSASQTMKNARPPVLRALARFALRSPYCCLGALGFGLVGLPLPLPPLLLLLLLLLLRPLLLYRPAFPTAALGLPLPGVALLSAFLLASGAVEVGRAVAAAAAAAARFLAAAIACAAALELVLVPRPPPPPSPASGATNSEPPEG